MCLCRCLFKVLWQRCGSYCGLCPQEKHPKWSYLPLVPDDTSPSVHMTKKSLVPFRCVRAPRSLELFSSVLICCSMSTFHAHAGALPVSLKRGLLDVPQWSSVGGRGGWAVGKLPVSHGQGKTLDSCPRTNCHLE